MKQEYKLLFIAFLTILFVDALGSLASRQLNFNYAYIEPISFFVYCALGFTVTKRANLLIGTLLTGMLGFFDATAGWKISMIFNANVGKLNNNPNLQQWVATIIAVTIYGLIVGLVSGSIAKLMKNRSLHKANSLIN